MALPATNSTKLSAAMEPTSKRSAPPSTLTKVPEALFRLNSAEGLVLNGRQPWHAGVKEWLTSGRHGSSYYWRDFHDLLSPPIRPELRCRIWRWRPLFTSAIKLRMAAATRIT